jgi:non-homologous end joining protein Ku
MRLECPIHGIVPREETVKGYETAKDEYVRFEPEELKALEQASSSALVIDSFVPETAVDPVYFEDTYYLGAGKNGERGYRVLTEALRRTRRVAVGTFTCEARRLRLRSVCTRTDSFYSGCTARARSTTRPRSTGAPSLRSATRSGRSPSG